MRSRFGVEDEDCEMKFARSKGSDVIIRGPAYFRVPVVPRPIPEV
jgi:hypothetical protein